MKKLINKNMEKHNDQLMTFTDTSTITTFVDNSTITSKINLKNMKTNKKQREISKKHYEKNKHIISERNKQNRKRQQRLDKIYFYGFWLLLTAILADTFINQILK